MVDLLFHLTFSTVHFEFFRFRDTARAQSKQIVSRTVSIRAEENTGLNKPSCSLDKQRKKINFEYLQQNHLQPHPDSEYYWLHRVCRGVISQRIFPIADRVWKISDMAAQITG